MLGSRKGSLAGAAVVLAAAAALAVPSAGVTQGNQHNGSIKHVLLISVDGLHQSDLSNYVAAHPDSTLASLTGAGTTYTNASTTRPSDSFPGMLAQLTGGTPKSTGVYYDDSYDRTLFPPPAQTDPSTAPCSGSPGAETVYAENVDVNAPTFSNPNGMRTILGETIDPTQLPHALQDGKCVAVQPNQFLWTNTIFSVAHAAGLRTAWSDKHPAYQIVNGHGTPNAVDDLFTPEINADLIPNSLTDTRGNTITFPFPSPTGTGPSLTDYVGDTEAYDQIKVDAILNQIDGHPSSGATTNVGVPAIFGMNFQSVSVGEKTVDPALTCDPARHDTSYTCDPSYVPGGYEPGTLAFTPQMSGTTHYNSTPTHPSGVDVPGALDFVDASLHQMVSELSAQGVLGSTRIILSAKHGQSPINPADLSKIGHQVSNVLANANVPVAQNTDDDVALTWLTNQGDTGRAVQALTTSPGQQQAHVQTVYSGATLAGMYGDPTANPRTPDLIVQPTTGTIYTGSVAKVAEHGGFADPDTHVALVVVDGGQLGSGSPSTAAYNGEAVQTKQIAPTILETLGLNPNKLDAVRAEGTTPLPGFGK